MASFALNPRQNNKITAALAVAEKHGTMRLSKLMSSLKMPQELLKKSSKLFKIHKVHKKYKCKSMNPNLQKIVH